MAKVQYSPASLRDLEEIGDFYAYELQNEKLALRVVEKIRKDLSILKAFPYTGSSLSVIYDGDTKNYRFFVSGNYIAFYMVVPDGASSEDLVQIDRIIHGKRDYIALLF